MHPKAAYMALHGLLPMRYIHAPHPDPYARIRWHRKDGEIQLIRSVGMWSLEKGLDLLMYVTIDWEDIPDALYDALPQDIIDSFLEIY